MDASSKFENAGARIEAVAVDRVPLRAEFAGPVPPTKRLLADAKHLGGGLDR
jgi:hypothetical protein